MATGVLYLYCGKRRACVYPGGRSQWRAMEFDDGGGESGRSAAPAVDESGMYAFG